MTASWPRTWLITGADKGLGLSAARAALDRGDRVVVTVLSTDGHHSLTAKFPETLRSFHLDAKDHARVGVIVNQAELAFGGVAMCRLVDEADPPLRLPLGADALQLVRGEIANVNAETDRWQELSLSTAFDG